MILVITSLEQLRKFVNIIKDEDLELLTRLVIELNKSSDSLLDAIKKEN